MKIKQYLAVMANKKLREKFFDEESSAFFSRPFVLCNNILKADFEENHIFSGSLRNKNSVVLKRREK